MKRVMGRWLPDTGSHEDPGRIGGQSGPWMRGLLGGYDDEGIFVQPFEDRIALHAEDICPDFDRARQDRFR